LGKSSLRPSSASTSAPATSSHSWPSREQILEDARTTIPRWRANKELIRKHYIADEDGSGGAFYIWPSKEAAQRGHDAEWFANIKARTGSTKSIERALKAKKWD